MFTAVRLLPVIAACSLLTSCQNGKTTGTDPYVSNYGNDGGYNPYPGQSGTAQSGGYSSTPTYTPPPAPVEADPYAFNAPMTPPKSTSSSSSSYSTPKKTVASSSKPKAKSSTTKKSTSTAKKSSGGSYKVAKGDTLYGIALKRKTTVAKIKSANGLSSDLIRPGQSLKMP